MTTQETRTKIVWDYAPAPESPEHVRLRDSYGLFVDGDFRAPRDGRRVESINPATEEPVAEVAFAGPADVRAAVESARVAQPESSSRSMAASRSVSRATLTYRSPRRTSSTTPAGRTSSPTASAGARSSRSVWRLRSCPGTSRC